MSADPLEHPLFATLVAQIVRGDAEPFALAPGAEAALAPLLRAHAGEPELPRLVLGLFSVAHVYREQGSTKLAERLVSMIGGLAQELGLLDAAGRLELGEGVDLPAWAQPARVAPHLDAKAPEGSVKAASLLPRRVLR